RLVVAGAARADRLVGRIRVLPADVAGLDRLDALHPVIDRLQTPEAPAGQRGHLLHSSLPSCSRPAAVIAPAAATPLAFRTADPFPGRQRWRNSLQRLPLGLHPIEHRDSSADEHKARADEIAIEDAPRRALDQV